VPQLFEFIPAVELLAGDKFVVQAIGGLEPLYVAIILKLILGVAVPLTRVA
jgi:hypothetical protein